MTRSQHVGRGRGLRIRVVAHFARKVVISEIANNRARSRDPRKERVRGVTCPPPPPVWGRCARADNRDDCRARGSLRNDRTHIEVALSSRDGNENGVRRGGVSMSTPAALRPSDGRERFHSSRVVPKGRRRATTVLSSAVSTRTGDRYFVFYLTRTRFVGTCRPIVGDREFKKVSRDSRNSLTDGQSLYRDAFGERSRRTRSNRCHYWIREKHIFSFFCFFFFERGKSCETHFTSEKCSRGEEV